MSLPKINIEKINAKFEAYGAFLLRHRVKTLLVFVLLLAVSVVGTKFIYVESSWDSYFIEGDPMLVQTDKFKETFGNDYFVGVLVESDHSMLDADNLKLLRELSNELRDSLSYSDGKATSIVDLEYMLGNDEGMEITQIVPEEIPTDAAGVAEIEKRLAAKPELAKKLISADRKQAWISVKLRPFPDDSVWKAEGEAKGVKAEAPDMQTGRETAEIIAKEKYATLNPRATGMPYVSFEKMRYIGLEMKRIFMLTIVFAIVVMFIVTRSLRGIVAPLLSTFAGMIMTFGLVGYLGLYMDATTTMVPVILAFAVSIAYNIHLNSFFRKHMMLTGKRKESVLFAMRETGWSVLFSGLTTIVALLSFLTVLLKPIRSVGVLSSIAVFFILLVALTISPVLLSFGKDKKPNAKVQEHGETEFDKDYIWKISEEVSIKDITNKGVFKYLAPFTKPDGNVVYSYLNVMMDLQKAWASAEDYYDYTCKAVKLDLAKKEIKALPIDYTSSWASYGKYIEEDGKVLFAVSTEKDGNAYFRYDPKTDKAEKIASVEQIPMWIVPLK